MTIHRHRGLARIVAPAAEPLTLAETKEFLRIDHTEDDARISDMIIAARTLAEQYLRRSLVTQSWKLVMADCVTSGSRLPMGPVASITLVQTIMEDGTTTTVPTTAYALSVSKDEIVLESTLYADKIEVTYVAGYGAASALPKPIKLGLLQHVVCMYDGTPSVVPIPDAILSLYMPFRELAL